MEGAQLQGSPRPHHPTVRFAEPPAAQQQPASPSFAFRLPRIGGKQQQRRQASAASPDDMAAIYDRHGYSPPRSPADAAGQWKYPLPSKSFRVYVGPPHRPADQTALSLPASRGHLEDATRQDLQLQRSRTEPTIVTGAEQRRQQQRWLATPYVQSRAEIFLRRRFPQPPLTASALQKPARLRREATVAPRSDEAERLRWTMSTQRHWQVDRKGQQRNQGPFSREFTVHVTAPSNWMRMKWGPKQPREDLWTAAQPGEQRPSYLYTKQAYGQQQHDC